MIWFDNQQEGPGVNRVCHGCQNIIREDEVCHLVLKSDRSQDDTESVKNLYFCKKCGRTLKRLAVRL